MRGPARMVSRRQDHRLYDPEGKTRDTGKRRSSRIIASLNNGARRRPPGRWISALLVWLRPARHWRAPVKPRSDDDPPAVP
jgi:hypothetical protein